MSRANHITKADLEKLHQPPKGAPGKGCLTRHQKRTPDHQCSHQWHAGERAKGDWRVYEVPGASHLSVNRPGNFDHFKVPYWHNAHHIIPNGALKGAITKAGKEKAGLTNCIKQGLLKATYNLNDKINMIILPMEQDVGDLIKLPRHLRGDGTRRFSHPDYSREAEESLKDIIDSYKQIALDAINAVEGKHEKPNATLSKTALETLSNRLYEDIKKAGQETGGMSLDEITPSLFPGGG